MRPFQLGALLLLCLACSASLLAQQSTPASTPTRTSDPQAVALVQNAFAALTGGVTVRDVTLTGTARRIAGSDGETGTATLIATSAGDSKVSLNLPSGSRIEVRNAAGVPLPEDTPPGVSAQANPPIQPVGAWSGNDGILHGIAAHNLMTDPTWFFPALTMANLGSSGNCALSYIGSETVGGNSVVHISAVQPSSDPNPRSASFTQHLSQMDLLVDPTTSLPVALSFDAHPDNNAAVDIAVRVLFSDYRAVSGARVPFHVQKYLNGSLQLDIQLSAVTFNSGLTASAFSIQ